MTQGKHLMELMYLTYSIREFDYITICQEIFSILVKQASTVELDVEKRVCSNVNSRDSSMIAEKSLHDDTDTTVEE